MKSFCLVIFVLLFVTSQSQTVTMTTLKIGEIKLGYSLDSVNKYIESKIKIKLYKQKTDTADYSRKDTVFTLYKNSKIRLVFDNYFDQYETKKQVIKLESIYTEDLNVSTKSGLKIGDDKFEIIKKLDGSTLYIMPNADKGKEYSVVTLMDYTNYNQISFYFKNNVLYALECMSLGESDGC